MEAKEGQEKPIPLLDFADFIVLSRRITPLTPAGEIPRLLFSESLQKPGIIPIHPELYNRPELYTAVFLDKIHRSMPDSLREDVNSASRVLGLDLQLTEKERTLDLLFNDAVVNSITQSELERFWFEAESSEMWGKQVGYNVAASKLVSGVTREGQPNYTKVVSYQEDSSEFLHRLYPLRRKIIEAYKYKIAGGGKAAELIVWHTHNTDYLSRLLIIRSFAVLFNNLGLAEVGLI